MTLIEQNMDALVALCRKYRVAKLWVFGSILTSRFNDDSDIDFAVTFDRKSIPLLDYADNFLDFIDDLISLFGRKIDLVCDDSIKNQYFRAELDNKKVLIYG